MGKYCLVLDTETTGNFKVPLVYDFSYLIFNKKTGENIVKRTFIIKEIFLKESLMEQAYYYSNCEEIWERIFSKEFQLVSFFQAQKFFSQDCKKYNIHYWYAYNAAFDKRSCNKTIEFLTKEKIKKFFKRKFSARCIWAMAVSAFLASDDYYSKAITNGWISEKGNIKSNAECAYKYISKNCEFEERHFGIDDCQIEKEIFMYCRSIKGKKNTKPNSAIWRKIQRGP